MNVLLLVKVVKLAVHESELPIIVILRSPNVRVGQIFLVLLTVDRVELVTTPVLHIGVDLPEKGLLFFIFILRRGGCAPTCTTVTTVSRRLTVLLIPCAVLDLYGDL